MGDLYGVVYLVCVDARENRPAEYAPYLGVAIKTKSGYVTIASDRDLTGIVTDRTGVHYSGHTITFNTLGTGSCIVYVDGKSIGWLNNSNKLYFKL